MDDLGAALRIAPRILCPGSDPNSVPFPEYHQGVIDWMIRMDMMASLRRRVILAGGFKIGRYSQLDSSHQLHQDYACNTEEAMKRKIPYELEYYPDGRFNPWRGFDNERRHMPLAVVGRGDGSAAPKASKAAHGGFMEAGKAHFMAWRMATRGQCSDQAGGERGVPRAPFGSGVGGYDVDVGMTARPH